MVFILGTWYLYLGVLRLCTGEVLCGNRTRHFCCSDENGAKKNVTSEVKDTSQPKEKGEKAAEEEAFDLMVNGAYTSTKMFSCLLCVTHTFSRT